MSIYQIPVYLPRINESRHLSIYWATGKLNSNFSFKLWWLSLTWNSSTRVLEHVKGIFYGRHHIYREIHAYLELLQQGFVPSYYWFIKAWFEEHCKSYINQLVILVLVMDMRFMQRKSLLQEVVQLGLELSFLID